MGIIIVFALENGSDIELFDVLDEFSIDYLGKIVFNYKSYEWEF